MSARTKFDRFPRSFVVSYQHSLVREISLQSLLHMINCNTAIKIKDALDNKPFKTMFAFATNDVAEARGKLRSKKSRTNRQNDETAGSRLPASTRNTDRISSTPEVNNNKSLEVSEEDPCRQHTRDGSCLASGSNKPKSSN